MLCGCFKALTAACGSELGQLPGVAGVEHMFSTMACQNQMLVRTKLPRACARAWCVLVSVPWCAAGLPWAAWERAPHRGRM